MCSKIKYSTIVSNSFLSSNSWDTVWNFKLKIIILYHLISLLSSFFLSYNCKAINFCKCIATEKSEINFLSTLWRIVLMMITLFLTILTYFSLSEKENFFFSREFVKKNFLFQFFFLLFAWRGKKIYFSLKQGRWSSSSSVFLYSLLNRRCLWGKQHCFCGDFVRLSLD